VTTKRYAFLTLLQTHHIESLSDLSVRMPTGTPTIGVYTTSRSKKSPERNNRRVDTKGSWDRLIPY